MSVTVLPFGGGELSSFDPLDNGTHEGTDSSRFNSAVSRCGIYCEAASAGFRTPTWAAAANFFFHAWWWIPSGSSGLTKTGAVLFYDGATVVAQFDILVNVVTIKTLQSSVMTTAGTVTLLTGPTGSNNVFDFRLVAGASGIAAAYLAGTEIFSATGLDHTDFSGVTQVVWQGVPNGAVLPLVWSQIICDDGVAHIGDSLVTLAEDTASAVNTGWFGAVTAINEIVTDDSTSVTSNAADQVSTYYKNGASLGSYNVVAVCVGVRAQLTTGSSTNLQVCLRTNGTNYFSPTIALDFGFQACCASWTNNPFTTDAWDPATAAIIEAGMKSIA